MLAGWHWLRFGLFLLFLNSLLAFGQQNPKELVADTIYNELHSQNATRYWVYRDANRTPNGTNINRIVETPECHLVWPLEIHGQKPANGELAKAKDQLEKLVHDPEARKKNREDIDQDSNKADGLMRILPDAFLFEIAARHGDVVRLRFRPDPAFHPATDEAKVFHAMAGALVINTKEKRLAGIRGKLVSDVDFGFGILGTIHKGGTFAVVQSEMAPGDWEVTSLDVDINGRALFFHTISEQQHERMTGFHQVPKDISLADAAKIARGEEAPPLDAKMQR